MSDNTIYKSIQRSNINLIIISLIVLAIAIGVGSYFSLPYFMGKFTGPTPIAAEDLVTLGSDSRTQYFREVKGTRMYDTYYYEETVDEDSGRQVSIDAYFGGLEIKPGVWLLVRYPETINERETTYVGGLTPITDSVAREVAGLVESENGVELLPVMLDIVDTPVNWYGGAAVLLVLLLGGLWGVMTFFQRNANPKNHPTLKKLATYGDVDKVIDSIDKELGSMPDEVGKLKLTRNWLVQSAGSTFEAIPYRDVVWAYKMIQTGKYNTKTYYAHVGDKHGKMLAILAKEEQVNQMLQAVMSHAPWAFAGYSEDLKKAWDKDRQQLVTAVEQRKAQFDSQSSGM
jgi:hypothetical protein